MDGGRIPEWVVSGRFFILDFCFCNTQAGRRKAPTGNLLEGFIPETETHTHFAIYPIKKAGL
jgi:hypothetical protein